MAIQKEISQDFSTEIVSENKRSGCQLNTDKANHAGVEVKVGELHGSIKKNRNGLI